MPGTFSGIVTLYRLLPGNQDDNKPQMAKWETNTVLVSCIISKPISRNEKTFRTVVANKMSN